MGGGGEKRGGCRKEEEKDVKWNEGKKGRKKWKRSKLTLTLIDWSIIVYCWVIWQNWTPKKSLEKRRIEIVEKGKKERERRKKNTWNYCACVHIWEMWKMCEIGRAWLTCFVFFGKKKKTKAGNWTERDFRWLPKKKKKENRETEEIRDKRERDKKNNYWIIVWEKNFDKIENTKNLSFDRVVR